MNIDLIEGDCLSNRYIYILFDPRKGQTRDAVFYVGRGTGHRAGAHVDEARRGADLVELLAIEQEEPQQGTQNRKLRAIQDILKADNGYTAKDMIRVVAQGLDVELATTLESFAIHHVFEKSCLTNIQAGTRAQRFRKHSDWENNEISLPGDGADKPYGVYVLRDPTAGGAGVFYVGKGTGARPGAHFDEAARALEDAQQTDKIATLRALQATYPASKIVRVIATGLTESEAFAIESFSLKYVYGFGDTMTNRVAGHHAERFRAKDDWELRLGFDQPFLVTGDGRLARRMEQDIMHGAGYDRCMMPIVNTFQELAWSGPRIVGAGALAFTTPVEFPGGGQGVLHVFTFSGRAVQIELRGNVDAMTRHLKRFNYVCRRRDNVYFPDAWASKPTRADRTTEQQSAVAVSRFRAMLALTRATDGKQLEHEVGRDLKNELLSVNAALRGVVQQLAQAPINQFAPVDRPNEESDIAGPPEAPSAAERQWPPPQPEQHTQIDLDGVRLSVSNFLAKIGYFNQAAVDGAMFEELVIFAKCFSHLYYKSPEFKIAIGYTGQPKNYNGVPMLVFADLHEGNRRAKPSAWVRIPLRQDAPLTIIFPQNRLRRDIDRSLIESGTSGAWRPVSLNALLEAPEDYLKEYNRGE